MNTELSRRLNIEYPDWHKQPFRLSVEEIENPHLVLEEFFEAYNLRQSRVYFWDLLKEANSGHESQRVDLFVFYEKVERLVEGAWILYKQKIST